MNPTASTAPLQLYNIRKAYGALVVTDDVTLTIEPGELHAIIGPNGAGKTTLIHQISGLARPDSGTIIFDGQDVTRLKMSERARLGLVRSFQITSILPRFSALENVAIAAQACSGSSFRFFGNAAAERTLNDTAMALLSRFGLVDRVCHRHRQISVWNHANQRWIQTECLNQFLLSPSRMRKDDPGFAICVAHVPSNQHLSSTIVDMKIVGRRDQSGVLRCTIQVVRKPRGPEQVQGVASARIIRFWPMEVEDIAVLTS